MARRVDIEAITKLKASYNLAEVIRAAVPKLRDAGYGELVGPCPFHKDDTPSLRVSNKRYHCFGCGAHGDILSWTMLSGGLTFPQAIEALSKGGNLPAGAILPNRTAKNYSDYEAKEALKIIRMNDDAQEYYCTIEPDWDAAAYLAKRFTPRAIERFQIGFAPLDGADFINYMLSLGHTHEDLLSAALIAQDSRGVYYARLRDRITIPLFGAAGHILGFAGRIIPRKDNEALPKYVNPPNTHAFNRKRYFFAPPDENGGPRMPYKRIILVEGYLDAISLWERGVEPVWACMGTGISKEQAEILKHYTKSVILLMDGDMPGLEAVVKSANVLFCPELDVKARLLSHDVDPDDFARAFGDETRKNLNALPSLRLSDLFSNTMVYGSWLTMKIDRSRLDEIFAPYVKDNIKNGWSHYNMIDWVMAAYPQYAEEIKKAIHEMKADTEVQPDGSHRYKDERIKALLKAWMKPCRDVRQATKIKRLPV